MPLYFTSLITPFRYHLPPRMLGCVLLRLLCAFHSLTLRSNLYLLLLLFNVLKCSNASSLSTSSSPCFFP
ncbi:hypothetical protein Peur_058806 [Populus x canadensis]